MKKYMITEDELRAFLKNETLLAALQCGGVDNWAWYGDSIREFVDTFYESNKDLIGPKGHFDLDDVIDLQIANYKPEI